MYIRIRQVSQELVTFSIVGVLFCESLRVLCGSEDNGSERDDVMSSDGKKGDIKISRSRGGLNSNKFCVFK